MSRRTRFRLVPLTIDDSTCPNPGSLAGRQPSAAFRARLPVGLEGTRLAVKPGEARILTARLGSEELRALRSAGGGRLRVQVVVGDRTVTRSWAIGQVQRLASSGWCIPRT